jgi:hypothetical protein
MVVLRKGGKMEKIVERTKDTKQNFENYLIRVEGLNPHSQEFELLSNNWGQMFSSKTKYGQIYLKYLEDWVIIRK